MRKIILSLICLSSVLFSAAPTCHSGTPTGYCRYKGKITSVYANKNNQIIIYFDTRLDVELAKNVGLDVIVDSGAIVDANKNKIFADYFYSTALTALSSNKDVFIQMG